ncbi:uncharacterized protein YcnI [Herbihabitans rhizosphaerae]|uniref:Uncharacterized protein YcnI n=1 Tax=Herbihabitans rhizosphaerae TaxID=1872711 RepID=A0A4Q7KML2_9PSEU|nr:YcnI family protein [Herbihabitans rhizosphaerae]RZS37517.1 uncharacterized protein YcnI [Herbihabitans rhizosphaerae]
MSTNRFVARAGVVVAAAGIATAFGGGIASAHVTAKALGEPAQQGGYTKITFRVPNEDNTAGTVKLSVTLPQEYPLTSVRTKPTDGWTAEVVKAKLAKPVESHGSQITEAVSVVTWTAKPGTRIGPGEFAEFELSVGKLPETTDQLVLPATQTYDNNKVVEWKDAPPAAGAPEPDRPAPVLKLSKKGAGDHGSAAPAGNPTADAKAAGDHTAAKAEDNTARWLGGGGLAVGALGLGIGAGAILRSRRTGGAPKTGERE